MIFSVISYFNSLIQTIAVAKSYYSCNNTEGVALENEGTANIASYVLLYYAA